MRAILPLLALTLTTCLSAGCKPTYRPICPEYYAREVGMVKAQWHAGKLTTSAATVRLDDLDASMQAYADDHYLSDPQKALIQSARK